MNEVIAIRMERELIKKIDGLSKIRDRSTIIRALIKKGYRELAKETAAKKYVQGKITLSEAAHRAGLTIIDMEHYLIDKGVKSQYSIEDLQKELEIFK